MTRNIDTQAIIDRLKNADDAQAEALKIRGEIGELTNEEQLLHDASLHVAKQFGEIVHKAAQVFGLAIDIDHNQLTSMIALSALGLIVPSTVTYGMPHYEASKEQLDKLVLVSELQIKNSSLYEDKT